MSISSAEDFGMEEEVNMCVCVCVCGWVFGYVRVRVWVWVCVVCGLACLHTCVHVWYMHEYNCSLGINVSTYDCM